MRSSARLNNLRSTIRWPGVAGFLRARSAWILVVIVLLTFAVPRLLPEGLAAVPFRDESRAPLALLLTSLPTCLITLGMRRPSTALERRPARLVVTRAIWWVLAVAVCAAATWFALGAHLDGPAGIGVRNTVAIAALTTMSARVMPANIAWVPGAALLAATLSFGTIGNEGIPTDWAWLLHGLSAPGPMIATALVVPTALYVYAVHDLAPPG